MLLLGLLAAAAAQDARDTAELFALAERRAPVARECLVRARAVLDGWWAVRDPVTGLFPRRTDQPVWAPPDNAADMYPFLVLTALLTAPERLEDLHALLRAEVELTTRLGWLPDWYSIPERRFLHAEPDIDRILFGATEYAKDGLTPLIELDGPDPWAHRMRQLLDGVQRHAPVASEFGPLPSTSAEVNGELLQALTRFHFLTGDESYLRFAERIADAYCLEVLPRCGGLPAHRWDFSAHAPLEDVLSLNDHGNEIVGGLAEAYAAAAWLGRESAARWEAPLRRMFDTLLARARNEDGLWVARLRPSTGEVLHDGVPDTWGYALAALVNFGLVTGEPRYLDAARRALGNIHQERYLEWGGADSFADSIEGALLLVQHLPEPAALAWLESVLPRFFAKQRLPADGGTGIVEGWYGDGNYARTALMVALCYSRGARVEPWSPALTLGGASEGERAFLVLSSEEAWCGRLRLDHPRHRDHFRLPRDLPRLNAFPEWFTVEAGELYTVRIDEREPVVRLGSELIAGLSLELAAGESLRLTVAPLGPPPHGRERGPADPFAVLDAAGGDPALIAAVDLDGGERYAGESYRWTERAPVTWRPRRAQGPVDATLWLRWGAKGDARRARVTIGDHARTLERGGYDGFDWVAVDVPAEWWEGDALEVHVEPLGSGREAFLSALRLRQPGTAPAQGALSCRLEAEDFAGDWLRQINVPGYSQRGFRVSNAQGVATSTLRCDLDLPPGRYHVWARGYEGDDQDRRFALSIGETQLEPTHRGRQPAGFGWQLAGLVESGQALTALEVRDAGVGFEVVDAVWITSDLAFDPGLGERVGRALVGATRAADPVGDLIARTSASAEAAHARIAGAQHEPAVWALEQARLRAALRLRLGLEPLPPRTPLNARTVGTFVRDGYRVERVVFESRPGFPVSANVYVPDGDGPFPAVLCPVGHWGRAKTEPVVQARCIGLAKLGYLALTYDPFGQGERDVVGNDHHEYFRSILVGWNNMTFMVWDTLRALDYLEQRGDVDPARVACTGASGGGLNTLYAAAIDERIRVAVPVVYVTRLREFLETRHSHCPCSHVNGLAQVMDMGDVAGLIAPRPLLMVTAGRDPSFTPAGARAAAAQAAGAYALVGAEDALAVREFDAEHDYDRPMREALYGWLAAHLGAAPTTDPLPEPDLEPEPDPALLLCFPEGRVPARAETVRSLAAARARTSLESARTEPIRVRSRLTTWLGASPGAPARPLALDPGLVRLWRASHPDDAREPVGWDLGEGLRMGGWRRAGDAGAAHIVVLGSVVDEPLRAAASDLGAEVTLLDLDDALGWTELHVLATDAHLLGESLLATRARGVARVLAALRGDGRPLVCVARDARACLILLLAQATWGGADAIGLTGAASSLLDAFEGGPPAPDAYAWRLLEAGDLPALRAAVEVPVADLDQARSERLAELVGRVR